MDQIIGPVKDPIPHCHFKLMLSKMYSCHKYSNSRQTHSQTHSQMHWAQPDPADHRNASPWSRAGGGKDERIIFTPVCLRCFSTGVVVQHDIVRYLDGRQPQPSSVALRWKLSCYNSSPVMPHCLIIQFWLQRNHFSIVCPKLTSLWLTTHLSDYIVTQ